MEAINTNKEKKGKFQWLSNHRITIVGMVLGSIAGYLYYHFIGCASGTCAITSKPINSTLYGALMGGLFLNMFEKKPKSNGN